MKSGCTYGRDCDSLNNPRPYRYFRLALTSLCPMNWGVSTISGRVAFPRLVVKRILSYEGYGLPGKRLLLILNLLRVCGLEAGHMDTSNLLEEFPREDVECLYLWMTQRINHLVGDGFVIRSGIMRTPRWPPITFFKPHRSHEPGLYFRYDSGLDFMTTSVKHFQGNVWNRTGPKSTFALVFPLRKACAPPFWIKQSNLQGIAPPATTLP